MAGVLFIRWRRRRGLGCQGNGYCASGMACSIAMAAQPRGAALSACLVRHRGSTSLGAALSCAAFRRGLVERHAGPASIAGRVRESMRSLGRAAAACRVSTWTRAAAACRLPPHGGGLPPAASRVSSLAQSRPSECRLRLRRAALAVTAMPAAPLNPLHGRRRWPQAGCTRPARRSRAAHSRGGARAARLQERHAAARLSLDRLPPDCLFMVRRPGGPPPARPRRALRSSPPPPAPLPGLAERRPG